MIPMHYALLLAAPLTFFMGGMDEPESDRDNVLRVYDVSTLSMPWTDRDDERGSMFMPAIGRNFREMIDELGEPEMTGVDTFIDMILELYEAEFEYEGRRVALGEGGRLVVRGPQGLHERVGGMLTFLESVVNAEAVLAIDTVVLTGPVPGSVPDSALIDAAAAEAWLRGLDATADHRRHEVRLRGDREASINLGHVRNAVLDFDVEIAQGAAIQDPIVVPVRTGTRLRMVGAPGEGGLFLAYTLERLDRLAADATQVDMRFWTGSEKGGLQLQSDSSRLDNLKVMTRSLAVSTFLPAGKALVLTQNIDVAGGKQREVVMVRQIGGGLPTRHELPLSREGAKLIFADLGAVSPPGLWARGTLFAWGGLEWIDARFNYEPVLSVGLSGGDLGLAMDLIDMGQDYSSLERIGRFLVSRPYGGSLESDGAAVAAEQAGVIASFDALKVAGEVLDVEVTVSTGGSEPVHARLAMRPGTAASLVLGVQSVEIRDYDVEVAQHAAVTDLQMETVLDGLCLWFKLSPGRGGDLMLTAKGGVQLREGSDRFDFGGQITDYVHQTESSRLMVDERLVMRRDGDAWTAVFGDTTAGGFSLSITVRKP